MDQSQIRHDGSGVDIASNVTVTPAQVPGLDGLLGLAVGVVVIAGLFFAKDVLIPITLAVLLSFVLSPIVAALRRLRVPRGFAIMLAVLSALATLGGIGTMVGMQAASLANNAPAYSETIQAKLDRVQHFAANQLRILTPATPMPAPSSIDGAVVIALSDMERDHPSSFAGGTGPRSSRATAPAAEIAWRKGGIVLS